MGTQKCSQQHAHAADSGVQSMLSQHGQQSILTGLTGQKGQWGPFVIDCFNKLIDLIN